MPIIETEADLLRLLDEDDRFLTLVRNKILTKELLELPQRFAEYAAETDRKIDVLGESVATLIEHAAETDRKIAALTERLNDLTEAVTALTAQTRTNTRHIGEIKGLFMERTTRADAAIIADEMGLAWQRTLDRGEPVAMWNAAHGKGLTRGISRSDRRSFMRADLLIEAIDAKGEMCFVAVEISYTADERDTTRAMRNAELIARFTGTPTYAAVASVFADNEILDVLTEDSPHPYERYENVEVFWSQLPVPETAY